MADDNKKIALNDGDLEKVSGGVDIKFGYEGYGTVISEPIYGQGIKIKPFYEVKSDDGWTAVASYSGPDELNIGTRVQIVKNLAGLCIYRC